MAKEGREGFYDGERQEATVIEGTAISSHSSDVEGARTSMEKGEKSSAAANVGHRSSMEISEHR